MNCDSCDTYLVGSLVVHCLGDAGLGGPGGSVAYFLSASNGWKSLFIFTAGKCGNILATLAKREKHDHFPGSRRL